MQARSRWTLADVTLLDRTPAALRNGQAQSQRPPRGSGVTVEDHSP